MKRRNVMIGCTKALCGSSLLLFSALAMADGSKDPGVAYGNTNVSVDAVTGLRTYGGSMTVTRPSGFYGQGGLNIAGAYIGTWDPLTKRTKETIPGVSNSSVGYCNEDPWQGNPGNFDTGCANVELGAGSGPGFTPNRFPFSAFWGAVPYGLRAKLLSEALSANQAKQDAQAAAAARPDGPPANPPANVEAYVFREGNKRQGAVDFVLPQINPRRWIDRFEVEVAFTPYQRGLNLNAQLNWLPDGSMPGPAMPLTSQTRMDQYYYVKKTNLDDNTDYAFRICAVNAAGRTCASPVLAVLDKTPAFAISNRSKGRVAITQGGQPQPANGNGTGQAGSAPAWGQAGANSSLIGLLAPNPSRDVGGSTRVAAPAGALARSGFGDGSAPASVQSAPGQAPGGAPPGAYGAPAAVGAVQNPGYKWGNASEPSGEPKAPEPKPPQEPKPKRDSGFAVGAAGAALPAVQSAQSVPPARFNIAPPALALPPAQAPSGMTAPGPSGPSVLQPTRGLSALQQPVPSNAALVPGRVPTTAPKPPLRPHGVRMREITGDPNNAEVSWLAPANGGADPVIDRFRVLVCPAGGNGQLCGGELAVELNPGQPVPPGSGFTARVPAVVPYNGTPSPVINIEVCAQNGGGMTCTDPLPIQFWQRGQSYGNGVIQKIGK